MKTPTRTCKKCGSTYLLTREFFYFDKSVKSGFKGICKFCSMKYKNAYNKLPEVNKKAKEKRKIYYYNPDNREKIRVSQKKTKDKLRLNPEYVEKCRIRSRNATLNLEDRYIRQIICEKNPLLSASDIPQEIIEIKRKQLKLKRDVKKQHQQG
jgi:hypothetical protein